MAAPRSSQRGQAVPLLLVVLALATGAALLLAEVAVATVERSRAQTAADAAALAGAAEGASAAEAVARANQATVEAYAERRTEPGPEVQVDVGHQRATAQATAAADVPVAPPADVGAAGGDREGLAPVLVAALARADQLLGQPVPVVSGFRTGAEQQALWADRANNPFPVAPPGSSNHEQGMAIDVPRSFVATLLTVAAEAGLCQVLPETDPIHFEPCPSSSPA
jgi:hypothetical protein